MSHITEYEIINHAYEQTMFRFKTTYYIYFEFIFVVLIILEKWYPKDLILQL